MDNWYKIAACPRLKETDLRRRLRSKGYSDKRISKDAVDIWQKGKQFFYSMGDWAIIKSCDVVESIKDLCPDAKIDGDRETRPTGPSWHKVL